MLGPLATMLEWSTKQLLGLWTFWPRRGAQTETRELHESTIELALLSQQHQQYVLNLVDLERKQVQDIYLPWNQVTVLHCEQSVQEVQTIVATSEHTRLLVLKGQTVAGVLNTKEFIALRAAEGDDWQSLDEDDEGTLRRILSSSPKARGHWPHHSPESRS